MVRFLSVPKHHTIDNERLDIYVDSQSPFLTKRAGSAPVHTVLSLPLVVLHCTQRCQQLAPRSANRTAYSRSYASSTETTISRGVFAIFAPRGPRARARRARATFIRRRRPKADPPISRARSCARLLCPPACCSARRRCCARILVVRVLLPWSA